MIVPSFGILAESQLTNAGGDDANTLGDHSRPSYWLTLDVTSIADHPARAFQ
jgi:hypothetical protein